MVYGFARQSEGIAIIDSEEGAGTTVRLLIPATAATKIFSCENFFLAVFFSVRETCYTEYQSCQYIW